MPGVFFIVQGMSRHRTGNLQIQKEKRVATEPTNTHFFATILQSKILNLYEKYFSLAMAFAIWRNSHCDGYSK